MNYLVFPVRSTLNGTPENATADAHDQATFNVVRQDSFRLPLSPKRSYYFDSVPVSVDPRVTLR